MEFFAPLDARAVSVNALSPRMVGRRSARRAVGGGGGATGCVGLCRSGGRERGGGDLCVHFADDRLCAVWLVASGDRRAGHRHLRGDSRGGDPVSGRRSAASVAIVCHDEPDDRHMVSGGQPLSAGGLGRLALSPHFNRLAQWFGGDHHRRSVGQDDGLPTRLARGDRTYPIVAS